MFHCIIRKHFLCSNGEFIIERDFDSPISPFVGMELDYGDGECDEKIISVTVDMNTGQVTCYLECWPSPGNYSKDAFEEGDLMGYLGAGFHLASSPESRRNLR